MRARPILVRVLLIALFTGAVWAAAQDPGQCDGSVLECGGACIVQTEGGPVDQCAGFTNECVDPEGEGESATCASEVAVFTPERDSWTYVFDPNNSIKITTTVYEPFALKVDRVPMMQTPEFDDRTTGTPFSEALCWQTLGAACVYYRVHGEEVPRDFYGQNVEYIVGFLTPQIQGNKHDFMLLRDPHSRYLGDPETPFPPDDNTFCQEITTKVKRHYIVPGSSEPDPGVGGGAPGFSDYTVAFQRDRPASRRATGCPEPLPTGPPGLPVPE